MSDEFPEYSVMTLSNIMTMFLKVSELQIYSLLKGITAKSSKSKEPAVIVTVHDTSSWPDLNNCKI